MISGLLCSYLKLRNWYGTNTVNFEKDFHKKRFFQGRDVSEAYKLSQQWFVFAVVSAVFTLIVTMVQKYYVSEVIYLLITIGFLYVVYRYMKELQSVLAGSPNNVQLKDF